MNELVSAWTLARTFNRIALSSFGGGLSAWSREIVVQEKGWMSDTEFLSASTICRIMPGANQVNLAVFVGMRLRGAVGAAAAAAGLVAAPTLLILVLSAVYSRLSGVHGLQLFLSGMASAAVGLTLSIAWKQSRTVLVSIGPVAICGTCIALTAFLRVPLWITLVALTPISYVVAYRRGPAL